MQMTLNFLSKQGSNCYLTSHFWRIARWWKDYIDSYTKRLATWRDYVPRPKVRNCPMVGHELKQCVAWGTHRYWCLIKVDDGINAVRRTPVVCFNSRCEEGIAALEQYRREWDDEQNAKPSAVDWTHPADAFR
jgi:hypothetical protein